MNQNEIEQIRRIESAATYQSLAPGLSISERTGFAGPYVASTARKVSLPARERFDHDGWFCLPDVIAEPTLSALRNAIFALEDAGLPAIFAYVYDEFWLSLNSVATTIAELVGPVIALPDIWAWHLRQGAAAKGWRAHRGSYQRKLSLDGGPALVNVWIPLTDVDEDNACMWLVPRSMDADYPDSLDSHAGVHLGIPIPAKAGAIVGWDANVLHWGCDMTDRAKAPRISFSFVLQACGGDALDGNAPPLAPDFQSRLVLIAAMLETYRALAGDQSPDITQWAQLRNQSATLIRSRSGARSRF